MVAAALVVVAIAAGCGGDNGSGGSASAATESKETGDQTYSVGGKTYTVEASTTVDTAELKKAQLIPKINELCRKGWATIRDNFVEYSSWQNPKMSRKKKLEDAIRVSLLAGIDFHIFDNIRYLGAPKGDERQVEEMIGAMQLAVERGYRLHMSSAGQVIAEFEDFNQRADQYGFDECLVTKAHMRQIAT